MKKLFHNKKKLWISLGVFALIVWNLAITAILSTTILQLNYMNDSLFLGNIHFLSKPVAPSDLAACVEQYLSGNLEVDPSLS